MRTSLRFTLLAGALAFIAPLFSQLPAAADPQLRECKLEWFLLTETRDEVARRLGPPKQVAPFGADFESWQYQLGEIPDHDDFSHALVFRKSDRTLISISRTFDTPRDVDFLFPENETEPHHFPDSAHPQFSIRVRRLPGGNVLMAMGVSKPGQRVGQVVLIRQAELRFFYPWLFEQLAAIH